MDVYSLLVEGYEDSFEPFIRKLLSLISVKCYDEEPLISKIIVTIFYFELGDHDFDCFVLIHLITLVYTIL